MTREDRIADIARYLDMHYISEEHCFMSMHGSDECWTETGRTLISSEEQFAFEAEMQFDSDFAFEDMLESDDYEDDYELCSKHSAAKPAKREAQRSPKSSSRRNLDNLIDQLDETFSERLIRMIYDRDLTESAVYKKAFVDRRHFSKIKNDVNYSPNKRTVFAFAIAMGLSLDETKDLLSSAGFAISKSSKFDIIISYFLEQEIYDMFEINDILYEYDQPIFE